MKRKLQLLFFVSALVLAGKAQESSSEDSAEDEDSISIKFDDSEPSSDSSGTGGLGDLLGNLNLGEGGLGGLLSSLTQGGNTDLLSSLSNLNLDQDGGKDLLSSLGKLDLGQGQGKGLSSILNKLNLNSKDLGSIINQLSSGGQKSGGFPLFKLIKNPRILASLMSEKSGRKLNFPVSSKVSQDISDFSNQGEEDDDERSTSEITLDRLQMAYKNYVNIFKLNNVENQDEGFNPEKQIMVSTSDGIIRGNIVHDKNLTYYSFLGIPYAEKPERFQASKLVQPWTGIKDTTKEKSICIQYDDYLQLTGGSEDCLFLNIHTPTTDFKNLPVIIWVHGGLFKFGASSSIIYGPQRLLKENVVVVTVNYRLGAFGFLSSGTKHAPGNAGLKDIVIALRWLQKNIHMFGGDTNNICLYGVSTGAGMVEYLQISKMAQGLFQKAIMQSGSTLSAQFFVEDPLQNAFKLAKYMGHYSNDVNEMMTFLSTADAEKVLDATEKMDKNESPLTWYFHFAPSVEEPFEGEEMFLCDTPERLLESGDYEQIPSLIGFSKDEGLHLLKYVEDVDQYLNSSNGIFEYLQPPDLFKCRNEPNFKKSILAKIRQFYFDGKPMSFAYLQRYIDMMGDIFFTKGVFKSLEYKSKHLYAPIYFSEFAFDGPVGLSKDYIFANISGVAHADDLPYVFKFTVSEPTFNKDKRVQNVSKKMISLYTNFLKYGNPTPFTSETVPVIWEPINRYNIPYLRISESVEMLLNPIQERLQFWAELYKSINRN